MSSTPDVPSTPPPPPGEPSRRHGGGGGFLALGIIAAYFVLFLVYLAVLYFVGPSWPSAFGPVILFLLVAILLTVRPRTRMFGTGLLIGLGVWVLLGGGLCIPLLFPQGGIA